MTDVRKIYLRRPWGGRAAGTRLFVLGPNDDLKRGYVDELRAAKLLEDDLASEEKEVGIEELAEADAVDPSADEEE